jgi:hypothetical protein
MVVDNTVVHKEFLVGDAGRACVRLCGFHHRMVHRQDWAITLAANGYPQLHPPPSIDPTGRPRQHHRYTIDRRLRCATAESFRPDSVTPHRRT